MSGLTEYLESRSIQQSCVLFQVDSNSKYVCRSALDAVEPKEKRKEAAAG